MPDEKKHSNYIIGLLVTNFNAAEMLVSAWIEGLTSDPDFTKIVLYEGRLPDFSACIDIAKRLVEIRCEGEEKNAVLKALQTLKDLSLVRNTVCHNPVLIKASDSEDSKKVFGWRKGKRNYSIEEIHDAGSKCHETILSLSKLYSEKFGHVPEVNTIISSGEDRGKGEEARPAPKGKK